MQLSQHLLSSNHSTLLESLRCSSDFLIIQDLDGVCMGLVKDPLTRTLPLDYLQAAKRLQGRFYVLTNGEHIGPRGVNAVVERTLTLNNLIDIQDLYLPGLAGGGVQWQDHQAQVSHPGVSQAELSFLKSVPQRLHLALHTVLTHPPFQLNNDAIEKALAIAVLDNPVSPTLNINCFSAIFKNDANLLRQLQAQALTVFELLLTEAAKHQLHDSFFIHLAPNLGRKEQGERIKWAQTDSLGTSDFQFMLQGAIKEVGVLVILNRYYHSKTGSYPLGEDFNARNAPKDHQQLITLAREAFDPKIMPRLVGVGDTVTSIPSSDKGGSPLRGGSDRGFLQLIQDLGETFNRDNAVVFVDSSQGELDRPGLKPHLLHESPEQAALGIRDSKDPLRLNFVFPEGHTSYVSFFKELASF